MTNLDHVHFEAGDPVRRVAAAGPAPIKRWTFPLQASEPGAFDGDSPDPFVAWLFQRAGVTVNAYRARTLRRRVPACLRALRVATAAEAQRMLEQQPDLLPRAVSTILIGVSGFFRDPQVWQDLQMRVLPELLRRRRSLRILSAGCSDGRELYSMAILLDELGGLERCFLLGEDCRPDAIIQGRAGMYDGAGMEDVCQSRRERFFRPAGSRYGVVPRLREHVSWAARDLLGPRGPGQWDMVLFRNVAIYMTNPQASLLWRRLCDEITVGGILVTGKAESPPAGLPLTRLAGCIYQKTNR